MNVLVIGSGGREHAICWKIKQSTRLNKLYVATGNAGISKIVDGVFGKTDFESLLDFVKEKNVDYIIVGPEMPLAEGIVDFFEKRNIAIFGGTKKAAMLESSKIFSKKIMQKYGIPTAKFGYFDNPNEAFAYLTDCQYPLVIKADGLAAGKGVIIAKSENQAREAISAMLSGKAFGLAGQRIVIEEFLEGQEASIFAFCDGKNFISTIASQDHKRALDGDKGLNTGGMGAYAPAPIITSELKRFVDNAIFKPLLDGMNREGIPYKGVLYAGLMLTKEGIKVLEFNCRFGDPETQVVLPLLKTDLMDIIEATINGRLDKINLEWHDKSAACVILASGGYPQKYEKGKLIYGLSSEMGSDILVFHAGTKFDENGNFITAGGRVLGITAIAENLKAALDKSYKAIEKIHFENMHFRKDIGFKAISKISDISG